MLVIQTILLQWTKDTRGEPYASLRHWHPQAYPLPIQSVILPKNSRSASDVLRDDDSVLLHRLAFWQTKEGLIPGQDDTAWLSMPQAGQPIDERLLSGVLPDIRGDRLHVRLRYVPEWGKPLRTDGQSRLLEKKAFELVPGEWGRIQINGRQTWEEGHIYELRTFHIAWGEDIPAKRFMQREPNRSCDWLESLW
ncbi:hypothetical protein B9G55_19895 [Saccharibacillus sp. O16]|nr:hypothetical protein B9G55_19895 [Saccharibacillus sp. O16]